MYSESLFPSFLDQDIYYHSFTYAGEHSELEAFFASRRIDKECMDCIDKHIWLHTTYKRFKRKEGGESVTDYDKVLNDVLMLYDYDRIKFVLARYINFNDEINGRFSARVRNWFSDTAHTHYSYSFIPFESHSKHINNFCEHFISCKPL